MVNFDITKYKDWYWCESSGAYNDHFASIDGVEELPIEFAKEVITDCDGLVPIEGKPNHYHKCHLGVEFLLEYVIYAFKDKDCFKKMIKKFEQEIDIKYFFKKFKMSKKGFFSFSNDKICNEQFIQCAQCLSNLICDLDEDYGVAEVPLKYRKILTTSKNILNKAEKSRQNTSIINIINFYLKEDNFLYFHDFKNFSKKYSK